MKKLLLILFVLIQISTYTQAQELKNNFNTIVRTEEGDLNNDGLIDKIVVTMDTVNEIQPLRLQIFFLKPNGKFMLSVSADNLMEPQYPNGKYGGNQIPEFQIENGYLYMISEIKEKHFTHTFKFNDGHFELQNISGVIWDGNNLTRETEFNLLTGKKTEITKALGSEKILKKVITKIIVKTLPKIDTFSTFSRFY